MVKVFFQPNVNINSALAQITAASQTVLKQLPAGITPPYVLSFNASSVPILQLALSSDTLSQAQIFDAGQNFIRPQLATVAGAAVPSPYGGKVLQVQIDLNQDKLQAYGLSSQDVVEAIARQNVITPVGTEKVGDFEYVVSLNDAPSRIAELNDLPIRTVNDVPIYIHDVAYVHEGSPPQTNMVRVNGSNAVLMTILKTGSASTLDVIAGVKALLPKLRKTLPPSLHLEAVGDQSRFVTAAVSSVIFEGVVAAALTGLMILIFLGSWRSTLIIMISIPLAILASVALLAATGETINVMTLGGLALAVGILVDDATVTIENINYHLGAGQGHRDRDHGRRAADRRSGDGFSLVHLHRFRADVHSGRGCRLPVSTDGESGRFRSDRLVCALAHPGQYDGALSACSSGDARPRSAPGAYAQSARPLPTRIRTALRSRAGFLSALAHNRFGRAAAVRRRLHGRGSRLVRARALPRAATSFRRSRARRSPCTCARPRERGSSKPGVQVDKIEAAIRAIIPPDSLHSIVDNIGLSISGINMAYSNTGSIGASDADILITLNDGRDAEAPDYVKAMRETLPQQFPGTTFAFLPADIVTQILNFGLPAPIDVQIIGSKLEANRAYAEKILPRIARVPGVADARIQQAFNAPTFNVDVDRTRAQIVGVSERDVAQNLQDTLAGSIQTAPTFWLNPKNGVSYPIVAQTPQYWVSSLSNLENIPASQGSDKQILGGVATIKRGVSNAVVSHYAVQPVIDIFATNNDRDLGAVAADIQKILDDTASEAPPGSTVVVRGQVQTMTSAYQQLFVGIALAVVLIYLLIVVNFQSWLDPFVIVSALPTALAGIVWMLFITRTTLSVPALTGAIMCMGVATANSILVISFARERLAEGADATTAAIDAGFTRFRPVLMTALAMIIGMAPMALSAELNAPLGRAVIGGLVCSTIATLLFVPAVFRLVHERRPSRAHEPAPQFPAEANPI